MRRIRIVTSALALAFAVATAGGCAGNNSRYPDWYPTASRGDRDRDGRAEGRSKGDKVRGNGNRENRGNRGNANGNRGNKKNGNNGNQGNGKKGNGRG